MAAKTSEFRKYIDGAQALPDDCVLGHIVWFGVPDAPYDATVLEQLFTDENLNPALLPPRIKSVDAFKKACTEVSGLKYVLDGGAATALIRDVTTDKEAIYRQVTREIKDGLGSRTNGYAKVADVVFYKEVKRGNTNTAGSSRMRCTLDQSMLMANEEPVLRAMLDELDQTWVRYRDYHDGQKIRGVVRDYLKHLNAVMMKPSVYFVHNTRVTELLALQKVVRKLGCTMSLLPLADLKELREEVVEAFQDEAVKKLETVVEDITRLRQDRKNLTPAAFAKMRDSYTDIMRQASEHTRVLQINQDRTAGAAEIAQEAIALLGRDVLDGSAATP